MIMIQKKQLLIILVALAGGLWSCSDTVSPGQAFLDSNKVTFQTTQSSYARGDTVTAILRNESADTIVCGNPFGVEQKKGGAWTSIDIDAYFTLEAIGLTRDDQKRYRFVVSDSSSFPQLRLAEGQYRVTTSIGTEQDENFSIKTSPFEVYGPGE
jgi:hypothetical protein